MGKPKSTLYEWRIEILARDMVSLNKKDRRAKKRAKVFLAVFGVSFVINTVLFFVSRDAWYAQVLSWVMFVPAYVSWWFWDDHVRADARLRGIMTALPHLVGNPLSERQFTDIFDKEGIIYVGRIIAERE